MAKSQLGQDWSPPVAEGGFLHLVRTATFNIGETTMPQRGGRCHKGVASSTTKSKQLGKQHFQDNFRFFQLLLAYSKNILKFHISRLIKTAFMACFRSGCPGGETLEEYDIIPFLVS